ncbi:hypothetical protein [Agarivorans sp. Z349TD_8]|uniref:hypothetical protein n=1 Tax=Agarivorans sp. Z349TD_8 TaxID=3421434 RepID=UPI003D7D3783
MKQSNLETLRGSNLKAGLFGGGYAGALGLVDGVVDGLLSPEPLNYPLIVICLFLVALGLPQKHIISLLLRSKSFAIKTVICSLFSLWLFVYFEHPIMKILALAPSLFIFFSSFKYSSTDLIN